jgi:hypothetical protein
MNKNGFKTIQFFTLRIKPLKLISRPMKNRSTAILSCITAVILMVACSGISDGGTGKISMIVTGNVRGQFNLCG